MDMAVDTDYRRWRDITIAGHAQLLDELVEAEVLADKLRRTLSIRSFGRGYDWSCTADGRGIDSAIFELARRLPRLRQDVTRTQGELVADRDADERASGVQIAAE